LSQEWRLRRSSDALGTRRAQLAPDLFAASADVRREAALAGELAHPRVVVGAVEEQALRALAGRLRPLDRDRVERRL
jgi:hypothetical protein